MFLRIAIKFSITFKTIYLNDWFSLIFVWWNFSLAAARFCIGTFSNTKYIESHFSLVTRVNASSWSKWNHLNLCVNFMKFLAFCHHKRIKSVCSMQKTYSIWFPCYNICYRRHHFHYSKLVRWQNMENHSMDTLRYWFIPQIFW